METRLQTKLIEKGIKVIIVLVRIGNVQVPQWVQDNAIKMQQQKDAAAIAIEEAKKANITKQTEAANAAADNQRHIDLAHAQQSIKLIEARGRADESRTNATAEADTQRIKTDADESRARKMLELKRKADEQEAEHQAKLLAIPGYGAMVANQAITSNTKFYWGDSLPITPFPYPITPQLASPVV